MTAEADDDIREAVTAYVDNQRELLARLDTPAATATDVRTAMTAELDQLEAAMGRRGWRAAGRSGDPGE